MNLTAAVCEWNAYRYKLVALGLTRDTTYDNQARISLQLADHFKWIELADLRKSHIELYIGERMKTCQPVTIRGELNVLRQILNWCVDEQMLDQRPRFPTIAVPNVEQALPSDAAFAWVLRLLPEQHANALEFMLLTGLAPHELERLKPVDHSNYLASPIIVPKDWEVIKGCADSIAIGHRADFPVKQPSRRRVVPLNARAQQIWLTSGYDKLANQQVFPNNEATTKAIQRLKFGDQNVPGADRITPKMMRKWFASKLAGDVAEHVLQALLGHAPGSKITRQHYVRSNDQERSDAVNGMGTLK